MLRCRSIASGTPGSASTGPARDAAGAMERGGVVRGQGRVQASARAAERDPVRGWLGVAISTAAPRATGVWMTWCGAVLGEDDWSACRPNRTSTLPPFPSPALQPQSARPPGGWRPGRLSWPWRCRSRLPARTTRPSPGSGYPVLDLDQAGVPQGLQGAVRYPRADSDGVGVLGAGKFEVAPGHRSR
jgi:hypothetical protein